MTMICKYFLIDSSISVAFYILQLFSRPAAKFLWKRIPENIKTEHPELKKIWNVGVALLERNLPEVYSALNQTWSEGISKIMEAVKGKKISFSKK